MSKLKQARAAAAPPPSLDNPNKCAWRIAEFRDVLGVCQSTVYNWISAGVIEVAYIGGLPLIITNPRELLAKAVKQPIALPPRKITTLRRGPGRPRKVPLGDAPAPAALAAAPPSGDC